MSSHKVKYLFSGKRDFYEVISRRSGEAYAVSLQLRCDCGGPLNPHNNLVIKDKGMCSHIEEVLKQIVEFESVKLL